MGLAAYVLSSELSRKLTEHVTVTMMGTEVPALALERPGGKGLPDAVWVVN